MLYVMSIVGGFDANPDLSLKVKNLINELCISDEIKNGMYEMYDHWKTPAIRDEMA